MGKGKTENPPSLPGGTILPNKSTSCNHVSPSDQYLRCESDYATLDWIAFLNVLGFGIFTMIEMALVQFCCIIKHAKM